MTLCEQVKSVAEPTKEVFSQITGAMGKSIAMFDKASEKAEKFAGVLKELPTKSMTGVKKIQESLGDAIGQASFSVWCYDRKIFKRCSFDLEID